MREAAKHHPVWGGLIWALALWGIFAVLDRAEGVVHAAFTPLNIPASASSLVTTTCAAIDGGTVIACPSNTRSQTTQNRSTGAAALYTGPAGLTVANGQEIAIGSAVARAVVPGVERCVSVSGTVVAYTECFQ